MVVKLLTGEDTRSSPKSKVQSSESSQWCEMALNFQRDTQAVVLLGKQGKGPWR